MMNPVIVDLHHEVLIPWSILRKGLSAAPQVVTLDFHTDTMPCDRRGNMKPFPGDWQYDAKVRHAVQTLHHDEHFDWALCSGLISDAFIYAAAPQNGPCVHERMHVLRSPELPDVNTLLNDPEKYRSFAERMLQDEYLSVLWEYMDLKDPWILDIDCDFCLTQKTLDFPHDSIFGKLIRNAALITISRESDWVRLLRFPGEKITGESIAEQLQKRCLELREGA